MRVSGLIGPAIFIVITGYVGCNKVLAVLFLSLGVGCGGIAMAGYNVNHLDLAAPFAGKSVSYFKYMYIKRNFTAVALLNQFPVEHSTWIGDHRVEVTMQGNQVCIKSKIGVTSGCKMIVHGSQNK